MKFNFAYDYLYDINSDWFEKKDSLYTKIGYKSFFLFLSLFRFRVAQQESKHQFITSIFLLRKCTGYSAQDILEMLLKLKRYGLIKIDGYSRREYFFDGDKIREKDCLVISSECDNENWDYNIPVDLKMIQHYIDNGLNEKYIGLYCLLRKLSNSNIEKKSYMSIDKMADILGFSNDTVHRMIYELNKRYLLYSWKVKVKDQDDKVVKVKVKGSSKTKALERFEHKLCYDYEMIEQFRNMYKSAIDKNMKNWNKGD